MFYAYGFTKYKRKTVIMLLTPYMPFEDPGPGYLKLDAYYIYSHRAHRETAEFIALLKQKGIEAAEFNEPVFKKLAVKAGIAALLGTNSLVYSYYHGSRFVLSAVRIAYPKDRPEHEFEDFMDELGAKRAEAGKISESINCYKCGQCIKACPMQAIDYNGLTPARCMRTYMIRGDAETDEVSLKMGGAFLGCDICQKACPMNRKGAGPMPEELKRLLKTDEFLKKPKEHTEALGEFIGQNYANVNRLLSLCINAAGNSGEASHIPLIEPYLESPSAAVKAAAARALKKLRQGG